MKKTCKKVIALVLVISAFLCSSVFALVPNYDIPSAETIIGEYQSSVSDLLIDDEISATTQAAEITELKSTRDSALRSAGYDVYYLNDDNLSAIETAIDSDLSEIGIDDGKSYMLAVGTGTTGARGSAGTQYTYTYNGTTYTMRNFVVTANDDEASSGFAQSSSVNVLKSSTQSVIENALNTAISAYVSSISNALGTVASICGLSISNFGTASQSTLNLNAGTNWTRVFTQVYSSYDQSWKFCSCTEYVYCFSYMSGTYYNASTNQMTAVPTNQSSKYVYSPNYHSTDWRKQQAAIAFAAGSPCKYDMTGAVYYKYGDVAKITHSENF